MQKAGVYLIICCFESVFIQSLGLPMLRTIACVGGTAMKDQLEKIRK